jgi:hypothetical protein
MSRGLGVGASKNSLSTQDVLLSQSGINSNILETVTCKGGYRQGLD